MITRFAFFLILLCAPLFLFGQDDRPTAEELSHQAKFIEANKEKILGNYEPAIDILNSLVEESPEIDAAWYELSRLHETLNQDRRAMNSIDKALAIDPENEWYYHFKADLHEKMGDPILAAEVYGDMAKQNPGDVSHLKKKAYYHVLGNEPMEAIKLYDQIEKIEGITEESGQRKHSLYVGMGKSKKAVAELRKLIERYPGNTEYRHWLGQYYNQIGGHAEAKTVYKEILSINPNDGKAKLALQHSNVSKPQTPGGTDYIAQLQGLFSDPNITLDQKIKTIIPVLTRIAQSEDAQEAARLIPLGKSLIELYPGNTKTYALLGDIYTYAGNNNEAINQYEQALALKAGTLSVWEQLLYLYAENQAYTKLASRSSEAIDLFPNQASIYFLHGMAQCELKNFKKAESILLQGALMARNNPSLLADIYARLGQVYFEKGDMTKSDDAFAKGFDTDPGSLSNKALYAYHLALKKDDIEEAAGIVQDLENSHPNHLLTLRAAAQVQVSKANWLEAKKILDKAIQEAGAKNPSFLEEYGDILFGSGDGAQAIRFWKKSLDVGNASTELKNKIQRVNN